MTIWFFTVRGMLLVYYVLLIVIDLSDGGGQ